MNNVAQWIARKKMDSILQWFVKNWQSLCSNVVIVTTSKNVSAEVLNMQKAIWHKFGLNLQIQKLGHLNKR